MGTWINQSVSLKMTHDFGGFSPFLLTNWQWYHQSCLPPHRRTHSQKYVLSLFVAVREEPLSTFGYFWKHKLSWGLTPSPRSWGQPSSLPEEIALHPLCLQALYHPYQGPWNPRVLCLTPLRPRNPALFCAVLYRKWICSGLFALKQAIFGLKSGHFWETVKTCPQFW